MDLKLLGLQDCPIPQVCDYLEEHSCLTMATLANVLALSQELQRRLTPPSVVESLSKARAPGQPQVSGTVYVCDTPATAGLVGPRAVPVTSGGQLLAANFMRCVTVFPPHEEHQRQAQALANSVGVYGVQTRNVTLDSWPPSPAELQELHERFD